VYRLPLGGPDVLRCLSQSDARKSLLIGGAFRARHHAFIRYGVDPFSRAINSPVHDVHRNAEFWGFGDRRELPPTKIPVYYK